MAAATPSRPAICVVPSDDVLALAEELQGLGGDDIAVGRCTILKSLDDASASDIIVDWLKQGFNATVPLDPTHQPLLPSFLECAAKELAQLYHIGISWITVKDGKVVDGLGRTVSSTHGVRGAATALASSMTDLQSVVNLAMDESLGDRIIIMHLFDPETSTLGALNAVIAPLKTGVNSGHPLEVRDLLAEVARLHYERRAGEHYLRSAQSSPLNGIASPLIAGNVRLFVPSGCVDGRRTESETSLSDQLRTIRAVCTRLQDPASGLGWIPAEEFIEAHALKLANANEEKDSVESVKGMTGYGSHWTEDAYDADNASGHSYHIAPTTSDGGEELICSLSDVPILEIPEALRRTVSPAELPEQLDHVKLDSRANLLSPTPSSTPKRDRSPTKSTGKKVSFQSDLAEGSSNAGKNISGIAPQDWSETGEATPSADVEFASPEIGAMHMSGGHTSSGNASLGNLGTDGQDSSVTLNPSPASPTGMNRSSPMKTDVKDSQDLFSLILPHGANRLQQDAFDDAIQSITDVTSGNIEGKSFQDGYQESVDGVGGLEEFAFAPGAIASNPTTTSPIPERKSMLASHSGTFESRLSEVGANAEALHKFRAEDDVANHSMGSGKDDDASSFPDVEVHGRTSTEHILAMKLIKEQKLNEVLLRQWQEAEQRVVAAESLLSTLRTRGFSTEDSSGDASSPQSESRSPTRDFNGLMAALRLERRQNLEMERRIAEEQEKRIAAEVHMVTAQKEAAVSSSRCRALAACLERSSSSASVFSRSENALASLKAENRRLVRENGKLANSLAESEVDAVLSRHGKQEEGDSTEIIADLHKRLQSSYKEIKKLRADILKRDEALEIAEKKSRSGDINRRIAQVATRRVRDLQERLMAIGSRDEERILAVAESEGAIETLKREKKELMAALEASEQQCLALNEVIDTLKKDR